MIVILLSAITVNAVQNAKISDLLDLGNKYLNEQKYEQAIIAFEDIIKIDKTNVDARIGLAKAYISLKKHDKAEQVLKIGIDFVPKSEKLYLALAELYESQGRTEELIIILQEGIEVTGSTVLEEKLHKIESAIEIFIEKDPLQVNNDTKVQLVKKDINGNAISTLAAEWRVVNPSVGKIEKEYANNVLYTGISAGTDTIIAAIGKTEFTKEINVKEQVLVKLEIISLSRGTTVGDKVEFKVQGIDQFGQAMEVNPEWITSDGMAEIVEKQGDTLVLNYISDGDFQLKVLVGDIEESVDVTINKRKYTIVSTVSGKGKIENNPNYTEYEENSVVTLKAIPDKGWHFVKWSGSIEGNKSPVYMKIDGNKDIKAIFGIDTHTLITSSEGGGDVSRSIFKDKYDYGTKVKLNAIPKEGYSFDHWAGDVSGKTTSIEVVMTKNMNIKAVFTANQYSLTINKDGNGTVTKDNDKNTYRYGENVQLTAIPDKGSIFLNWEGDISGDSNPYEITLNSDKTVKAIFVKVRKTSGVVTNATDNNPIEGAIIKVRKGPDNKSGEVYKEILTNDSGEYELFLPAGEYTFEIIRDGFSQDYITVNIEDFDIIKNISMNEINEDSKYRIVLEWGNTIADLDAHTNIYSLIENVYSKEWTVNYNNKIFEPTTNVEVELDLDDTSYYGPETTTIYETNYDKYEYIINDYTNSGELYSSKATVKLYKNNELVKTFNVPTDVKLKGKLNWHVFDLIKDNNGYNITEVNTLID